MSTCSSTNEFKVTQSVCSIFHNNISPYQKRIKEIGVVRLEALYWSQERIMRSYYGSIVFHLPQGWEPNNQNTSNEWALHFQPSTPSKLLFSPLMQIFLHAKSNCMSKNKIPFKMCTSIKDSKQSFMHTEFWVPKDNYLPDPPYIPNKTSKMVSLDIAFWPGPLLFLSSKQYI